MGFIPKWIWHVNGMSTTRDLLHDMYCILLRCGSFQNESGMFTKSIGDVVRAMMCGMEANCIVTTWKLRWCLTFYIPVWASSWGTRLYIFFSNVFNIFSLFLQTTAVLIFYLHCENTSAHALKAVINVRNMLDTQGWHYSPIDTQSSINTLL